MHESKYAGCFIIDSRKKILLQFRGPFWKSFPNCWCNFGGKIEEGETIIEGISRELKEEINIEVDNEKLEGCWEWPFCEPEYNRKGTMYFFKYFISDEEIENIKLLEGNGLGWFTYEEILELKTTPNLKEALKNSFEK